MKVEEYNQLTPFERAMLEEFQKVRSVLEEMGETLKKLNESV